MWLTIRTEARLARARWRSLSLVTLALALGLAIAGTLGSLADSLIWRPLQVSTGDRLLAFERQSPDGTAWTPATLSPEQIRQLRLQAPPHLAHVAGVRAGGAATTALSTQGATTQVRFATATPGFFPLFDLPEVWTDASASGTENVVVSHHLMEGTLRPAGISIGDIATIQAFDPETFGTRARPLRIASVAPRGFHFPGDTQLWLPATRDEAHFQHFALLGLLNPGITQERLGESGEDWSSLQSVTSAPVRARSLRDAVVPDESRLLTLLLSATIGLLLTVWCQAALFTAGDALSKRRALDTRLALGASRARVVAELMVGPMLVAAAAFPISTVIAAWLHRDIVSLLPMMAGRRVDYQAIAIVGCAVATLVFLAAQALLIDRVIAARLRRGAWRPPLSPSVVPSRLAAISAGISLFALYVSLLLAASFHRTLNYDYGFDTRGLVAVHTSAMVAGLKDPEQQRARLATIEDHARRLPGVTSVVRLNGLPFGTYDVAEEIHTEGDARGRTLTAKVRETGSGLFDTLQVPQIAGRDFHAEEEHGAPVAIVTQRVADELWPTGAALDSRITIGDRSYRVVGVVADFSDRAARGVAPTESPQVFIPMREGSDLLVRTSGNASVALDSVRAHAAAYAPYLRVNGFTYDERRAALATNEEAYARVMGILAAGALLIAMVGGFATVAQAVQTELRSSAIRLGLGATRGRALLTAAAMPLVWLGAGSLTGVAGGVAAGQVLRSAIRHVQGPELLAVALCLAICLLVLLGSLAGPARLLRRLDVSALLKEQA